MEVVIWVCVTVTAFVCAYVVLASSPPPPLVSQDGIISLVVVGPGLT